MEMLRLLVGGGNGIARRGLCAGVEEQFGWELAAVARDGREAVRRTRLLKPDVAIMDIDMPSLSGLDATRQIAKGELQTKVLLLAQHHTDQLLPQALEAGAHGCLLKSDTAADLVSAVEALRQGKSFFSARAPQRAAEDHRRNLARTGRAICKDALHLTGRQREVLQLLAEGHTSKQVGIALNIST